MAKKKSLKSNRKHQFKYASPSATSTSGGIKPTSSVGMSSGADARDYSYVGVDLRRIAWLGGGLIILQLVIWFIFTHTGIGPSVYNLVQI